MRAIIALVTARTRLSDTEESKKGRFEFGGGQAITDNLSFDATSGQFDSGDCLDYVYQASLPQLFANETSKVADATSAYSQGLGERRSGLHSDGTLARLASDLRTGGLVGPVNIIRWKGDLPTGGHAEPPAALFERLSNAGEGWYFFLVALTGHHTFVVAVEIFNGKRSFKQIQGGQTVDKTAQELDEFFDREGRDTGAVAHTKVWQVYTTPDP